jgi:uncharacterized repeat protein (TIGR01451 family)
VTFTATVTSGGGTPTGTVQFQIDAADFGTPITLVGGVATSSARSSLSVGNHPVTAAYSGDANYNASTGTLVGGQTVNQASTTTTITSDAPDPSNAGQAVTVQYSVSVDAPGSGTPTGTVTVTASGGTEQCSAPVAAGSCLVTLNGTGVRTLTAEYSGDASFASSLSASENHQVDASADVGVTKTGSASVAPGTNLAYTLTVTNAGPSDAAGVVLSDPPPTGLTFVSATVPCAGGFPCTLGTIAAGAPATTVTVTFGVPSDYTAPDPIVNTASVSATTTDPLGTNNSASASTSVSPEADLGITDGAEWGDGGDGDGQLPGGTDGGDVDVYGGGGRHVCGGWGGQPQ